MRLLDNATDIVPKLCSCGQPDHGTTACETVRVDSAPRHVAWDFERGQAIAYERHGECKQCGACCRGSVIIESNGRDPIRGHVVHSGVWYELPSDEKGRLYYRVKEVDHDGKVCNCLTEDKLCGSRDNGAYAPICQHWSVSPDHQLIFPTCGYSFVEVERWEIGKSEQYAITR